MVHSRLPTKLAVGFYRVSLVEVPISVAAQRRDLFIVAGNTEEWTYSICLVDSAYETQIRSLEIQSNTTKLSKESSFLNGPAHDDVTVIRGLPICGYAGLYNSATLYNVVLPSNETLEGKLTSYNWYSPSFAIWFNNNIVTFLYTGISIESRVNATTLGPYSYSASSDGMQFIGAWEAYLDPSGDGYFLSLRASAPDTFITVIERCTTTCSGVQNITSATAATFSANSTHYFSCFKDVTTDGSTVVINGSYQCMVEGDSTRYTIDQIAVDYPIQYTTGSLPLHSCIMGNTYLVVSVHSGDVVTYNLYLLDTTNGFEVIAKSPTVNAVTVHAISCRDKVILVATDVGVDYWVYDDGTGITFPTVLNNVTEPIANIPAQIPIDEQTVTPTLSSDANKTVEAIAKPDDSALTIGLTVGLICGSAIGIGMFLLIFFVKKDQRRRGLKKEDDMSGETNYTPLDAIFAKTRFIPYEALTITKEIGSGSFGKVCLGEWNSVTVAIKMSNLVGSLDSFMDEARLTLALPAHSNVVYTYGLSMNMDHPHIVLEYCEGGSLDKLLAQRKLSQTEQRALVYGIALGLVHLHDNKIVHRDLAARNILLKEGKPKISDFGMSRVLKGEAAQGQTNTTLGPIRWKSPESIRSGIYSPKSDVWSFGIVVSEIVTGKEPHLEEDQIDVAVRIRDQGYTPQVSGTDVDPVLRELMQMCWRFNPDLRPSPKQLVEFLTSHV